MTEYDEGYINKDQLKNKNIEPDAKQSRFVNRNLQLGKINPKLLPFYFHRVDRTTKYTRISEKYGGFVTKRLSEMDMEIVNMQFVMSGSSNGFVREINATERKVNQNQYSEVKLGRFGRMGKQQE